MAFDTSTSEQRVELLRQAEKTANLTRRVTIGSGVMDDAAKAQGDALCGMLESALADIGYGGLPPDGALVEQGQDVDLINAADTSLGVFPAKVDSNSLRGLVVPATTALINNGVSVTVTESNGTTVVSSLSPAVVSGNSLQRVTLPATIAAAANGASVPGGVVNSAGADTHPATFTIAGGKVTNVKITSATTAMVDQSDTVSVQNSAGANGIGGTAQVSAGVITAVRLPAASAAISNGAALTVPVTGTYTTTATIAIANGVITGITLS